MTPVDKDDFEDAEFARLLEALPQPEPSLELDAAILALVQKDLTPGPAAANDPAVALPRPRLVWRYRVPLAFAASLAGIAILLPAWRGMPQREVPVIAEPPAAVAELPAPSAKPEIASVATPSDKAGKKPHAHVVIEKPAAVIAKAEPLAPAPENAPAFSLAQPPAPALGYANSGFARARLPATYGGSEPASAELASSLRYKSATTSDFYEGPAQWLKTIEQLLDAGETASASAQWKRFRTANPYYPVPDTLAGRLKALE